MALVGFGETAHDIGIRPIEAHVVLVVRQVMSLLVLGLFVVDSHKPMIEPFVVMLDTMSNFFGCPLFGGYGSHASSITKS